MTIYKKRWCPNGCGKKCIKFSSQPYFMQLAKYRCSICKSEFNSDQLSVINNIKKKAKYYQNIQAST